MNFYLFVILFATVGLGLVGQWLDGFTTYQGVKKFGPSIEGDKAWFAQFLVKHPPLLLFMKPLILALLNAGWIWAAPRTNGGGYALAIIASTIAAILGFDAAYSNYKINQGPKA